MVVIQIDEDEIGIIRALGLAAVRAIADLRAHGVVPEDALVGAGPSLA